MPNYTLKFIRSCSTEADIKDFIDIQKRRLKVKNQLERCKVCSPNGNQHK
ncbi:hypothetical protein L915_20516, partial [Phytophthora nicotianae]